MLFLETKGEKSRVFTISFNIIWNLMQVQEKKHVGPMPVICQAFTAFFGIIKQINIDIKKDRIDLVQNLDHLIFQVSKNQHLSKRYEETPYLIIKKEIHRISKIKLDFTCTEPLIPNRIILSIYAGDYFDLPGLEIKGWSAEHIKSYDVVKEDLKNIHPIIINLMGMFEIPMIGEINDEPR